MPISCFALNARSAKRWVRSAPRGVAHPYPDQALSRKGSIQSHQMNQLRPVVTILLAAVLLAGVGITASPKAGESERSMGDVQDSFPDFGLMPPVEQFKGTSSASAASRPAVDAR